MSRRMRVVSEQDYMLLESLKKRPKNEQLEEKKIATLDQNIDISDDVRAILYNDAARRLQKQHIIDKNTPVLTASDPEEMDLTSRHLGINSITPPVIVKDPVVNPKPIPKAVDKRKEILQKVKSKKGPELLQLLEDSNVTWNNQNELIVGSKRVPGSDIVEVLNALSTGRNFMSTNGMQGVASALQHKTIPFSLLNRSIQSTLKQPNVSPKKLRSHNKNVNKIPWNTF